MNAIDAAVQDCASCDQFIRKVTGTRKILRLGGCRILVTPMVTLAELTLAELTLAELTLA